MAGLLYVDMSRVLHKMTSILYCIVRPMSRTLCIMTSLPFRGLTHQLARPADADQRLVGIRQRELVHAPWLVRWCFHRTEDRIANPFGQFVDALGVEIE